MTTSDSLLSGKVEKIRNYGQYRKYHHTELGWNSRLDSLQAIVLIEKLKLLDEWNSRRRIVAEWYYENLKEIDVVTYHESTDNDAVHHLFVITLENRDHMVKKLSEAGIPTGIHYPIPIHKHKCFAELRFVGRIFLQQKINPRNCFPCLCTNLTEQEVQDIARKLLNFL